MGDQDEKTHKHVYNTSAADHSPKRKINYTQHAKFKPIPRSMYKASKNLRKDLGKGGNMYKTLQKRTKCTVCRCSAPYSLLGLVNHLRRKKEEDGRGRYMIGVKIGVIDVQYTNPLQVT